MPEFWESIYSNNDKMWGEDPTDNARYVLELFRKNNVRSVLIPGFGYGRNARVFHDAGMIVSGIEISATAIKRARKYFSEEVIIHHGSVSEMPFDNERFDAVYCWSLIHLLNKADRLKLIENCHAQLEPYGLMVFTALSIYDKRFGEGQEINKNTFQSPNGLALYFYDEVSVREEFGKYDILELSEINEPEVNPNERQWMIICRKNLPCDR